MSNSKYANPSSYRELFSRTQVNPFDKKYFHFFNDMHNECAKRASRDGREFLLYHGFFQQRYIQQGGLCIYTGCPLSLERSTDFKASPERIDRSKGYTPANTWLSCLEYNSLGQWSQDKVPQVAILMKAEVPNFITVSNELSGMGVIRQYLGAGETGIIWEYWKEGNRVIGHECFEATESSTIRRYFEEQLLNDKQYALRHNLTFNIQLHDYLTLYKTQQGRCAHSRVPLRFGSGRGHEDWQAMIERINVMKGYEPGNIRLVCQEFKGNDCGLLATITYTGGSGVWTPIKFEILLEIIESNAYKTRLLTSDRVKQIQIQEEEKDDLLRKGRIEMNSDSFRCVDLFDDGSPVNEIPLLGFDLPPMNEIPFLGFNISPSELLPFGSDKQVVHQSFLFGGTPPPEKESLAFGSDKPGVRQLSLFGGTPPPEKESLAFGSDKQAVHQLPLLGSNLLPGSPFRSDNHPESNILPFCSEHHKMPPIGSDKQPEKQLPFFGSNKPPGNRIPPFGSDLPPKNKMPPFGSDIRPKNEMPHFGSNLPPKNEIPPFGSNLPPKNKMPPFGSDVRPRNEMPPFGSDKQLARELLSFGCDLPRVKELPAWAKEWVQIQNNMSDEQTAFDLEIDELKYRASILYPRVCKSYDVLRPNGDALPINQHGNWGLQYKVQTIKPRLDDQIIMRATASYCKSKLGFLESESLETARKIMDLIQGELHDEARFTTKRGRLNLLPITTKRPVQAKRPLAADIYIDPDRDYVPSRTKRRKH